MIVTDALSDEELVTGAAGGDTQAFGQLVKRYQRAIFAYALAKTGNRDDADEFAATIQELSVMPKPRDLLLLRLKYRAGLSLEEIAHLLGWTPALVKSRLHAVRRSLAKQLTDTSGSYLPLIQQLVAQEERIMQKTETVELGAYVFSRLSLAAQMQMSREAVQDSRFSAQTLTRVGEVDRGAAFIEKCDGRLIMRELVDILGYCDPYVERRLISALDVSDPDLSMTIKQNFFVFEDVVLFDQSATRKLVERISPSILNAALLTSDPRVKQHFASFLTGGSVLADIDSEKTAEVGAERNISDDDILSARISIVEEVKRMTESGELIVARNEEDPFDVALRGV